MDSPRLSNAARELILAPRGQPGSRQGLGKSAQPFALTFSRDFKAVPARYRALVPEYVKDYVSLNQFAP